MRHIDEYENIVSAFGDIVTECSDKCALKFKDMFYTYRILNEITDVIANNLKKYVKQNRTIAFYMDKSDKSVIMMLSILKCGCSYLPLSKVYPMKRIAFMLERAKVNLVVVEDEGENSFGGDVQCLLYDELLKNHYVEIVEEDRRQDENEIAYVLFTSGSTGIPKGITVRQSSILNLAASMSGIVLNGQSDKNIAVLSTFVFDVSMGQVYLALLTGNALDVIPDETKMYCDKLEEFFLTRNIFCCEITPTRMNTQLEYYKKNELHAHLPQVVLSVGEALPLGIAKQFFMFAESDIKLINFYGPTETCVYSSYYEMNSENIEAMDCMLIGKPILQTSLYVLNEQLNPCGIGEDGELYIGGAGLATGYIGQPELTEKVFVPNPFQIGTRLYKTNDLVRMKDSLDVEYIGRKDRQIKLHGFR